MIEEGRWWEAGLWGEEEEKTAAGCNIWEKYLKKKTVIEKAGRLRHFPVTSTCPGMNGCTLVTGTQEEETEAEELISDGTTATREQ